MTDDEFNVLLEDSDVPWAHFFGGEGKRYVEVSALLSLAKERGFSVDEPELDQHVARRGGSKETEVWDLGNVPRNLLRALVRRPRKRGPAGYIIP